MSQLVHPELVTTRPMPGYAGLLDDRRLATVEAYLRVPGTAVLSLDCFDTLLWRKVPKPTDAFFILGQRLAAAGMLTGGMTARSFAYLRLQAEHTARERRAHANKGSWEINLGDIYAELSAAMDFEPSGSMQAEIEMEKDVTVADPLLAETLAALVDELNLRVVVVSDMYLSGADIGYLLDRPEMRCLTIESVITSNEAGISKEHGLWHLLPGHLGVQPGQIVHIGNNHRADFLAPEEAGVRAVYYPEAPERLKSILVLEGTVGAPGHLSRWCEPSEGDGGMTAIRGRAAYAAASAGHADQVAWETGACVVGPVLSAFADWLHERTADLHISRVLCLMREGRFLAELMAGVAPSVANPQLRSSLLWVSREAVARASFFDASDQEMSIFFEDRRPPALGALAEALGVDLASFPDYHRLAADLPHRAADVNLAKDFLGAVLGDAEAVEQIKSASARRRANLIAHLRTSLDGATGDVALVDVGWRGTMQEKLQFLADRADLGVRFHGLYLMTDTCPTERLLAGHRLEGFLGRPGDPLPSEIGNLGRNRFVLEEFLLGDDGSTLEIDDGGRPMCADYRPPAAQAAQRDAVQDGIRAFQRQVSAYRRQPGLAPVTPSSREAWARRILERFVAEPSLEEARAFAGWELEDAHGNVETSTFVPSDDEGILRRYTADELAALPFERIFWPAGASALWGAGTSVGMPGELSPAGLLRIDFRGPGPVVQGSAVAVWQLGRGGVSTVSWSGPAGGVESLCLRPGVVPGLLRLDLLTLYLQNQTGWRSVMWSWRPGDDPARISLEGAAWVAPNLVNISPESRLSICLEQPLPSSSELRVDLVGGFLNFNDGLLRWSAGEGGPQLNLTPF